MARFSKRLWIVPLTVGAAIGAVYWLVESERHFIADGNISAASALLPSGSSDLAARVFVLAIIGFACVAAVHVAELMQRTTETSAERDRAEQYLNTAGSLMLALDRDGRISMANPAMRDLLGEGEVELEGRDWFADFDTARDRDSHRARYAAVLEGAAELEEQSESLVCSRDGSPRLVKWTSALLRDDDGKVSGVLSSGLDITEEREKEDELKLKSFLLDSSFDSVVVHTFDGRVIYANARACEETGMTRDQFMELPAFGWLAPERREQGAKLGDQLGRDGFAIFESAAVSVDGRHIPLEIHAHTVEIEGEKVIVSSGRDISERKQAEETIARMAFYDQLTGLPNRSLFLDRLRIALAQSARSKRPLAVLFLDLDHFKHVNDTLGHNVGDRLLQAVAGRLSHAIREGDTLARLGGDEFTFVLPDIVNEEHAAVAAGKLLRLFDDPFDLDDGLHVTASIGVTVLKGSEATVEDAIGRADAAMYRAKEDNRNCYRFYEEQMRATANERFSLKSRLHAALENHEFVVFYQPQVRAESGLIIGVEALVRWAHPEKGLLFPGAFLEIVEEAGLMDELGTWVLRTACGQAAQWLRDGAAALKVAVNVTPRQFVRSDFSAIVADALVTTGLPSELLELEVTESAAFADLELLERTLASLRSLGVRIAIDDFGTGFNSLDRLRKLRVDAIKIDRSFVAEVETHPDAAAIANTVVVLAHHLGLAVVGEGVETPSQAEFLRARGCDVLQGFLYSAAVPAHDLVGLLRAN